VEGPQEGVLGDVLRHVLASHEARYDAENDVAVALDELLEGAEVAVARRAHQGLIGITGHGACDLSRSRKVTSFSVRSPVKPPERICSSLT